MKNYWQTNRSRHAGSVSMRKVKKFIKKILFHIKDRTNRKCRVKKLKQLSKKNKSQKNHLFAKKNKV
jgi:hypothetical protein